MELTQILMVCLGLALLTKCGEGTISAWATPSGTVTSGKVGPVSLTAIPEDSTGTLATVVATSDKAVTYTLDTQTNAGQFAVSTSGAITLECGQTLDFETAPSNAYVLDIVGTDSDGAVTATISLVLTDVNEAPAFTNPSIARVTGDCLAAGTAVTTWVATDPESGTLSCAFASGNGNGDLAIAAATGAITVATGKTLSSSTTSSYTLVVTCADNNATPLTGTSTLTLCVGSASNCPAGSGSGAGSASVSMGLMAMVMAAKILNSMQ